MIESAFEGSSKDHLAWAKHPASDTAAAAVLALAKKDRRFAPIAQALLEDGVINQAGRLLIGRNGLPVSDCQSLPR